MCVCVCVFVFVCVCVCVLAWFEAVVCTETIAGVSEEDSSSLIVETVNRMKTTTAATMYQDVLSKIQNKSTQS